MNDAESILLKGLEDSRQAMLALLESTHRSLHLYTPYLDPRLYNDAQVMDTLRARLVRQSRLRLFLLLPPAAGWRRRCPRLLQLATRLSSAMELRTPPQDQPQQRPELAQSFMIADQRILLHQTDPRRFIGSYEDLGSEKIRVLLNFFTEIWERSEVDPELRRWRL